MIFRDEFQSERPLNDVVYYRPPERLNEQDSFYISSIDSEESLISWCRDKCFQLVREITFANAEELTDEGLPFLILFHKSDDHQSVALFEREVAKQLLTERCKILFDLGNVLFDLWNVFFQRVLIVYMPMERNSFIHFNIWANRSMICLYWPLTVSNTCFFFQIWMTYRNMLTKKMLFFVFSRLFFRHDGKLLQFVKDLHSEKLHRDFHNPPPSTQRPTTTISSFDVTDVFFVELSWKLFHGFSHLCSLPREKHIPNFSVCHRINLCNRNFKVRLSICSCLCTSRKQSVKLWNSQIIRAKVFPHRQ